MRRRGVCGRRSDLPFIALVAFECYGGEQATESPKVPPRSLDHVPCKLFISAMEAKKKHASYRVCPPQGPGTFFLRRRKAAHRAETAILRRHPFLREPKFALLLPSA